MLIQHRSSFESSTSVAAQGLVAIGPVKSDSDRGTFMSAGTQNVYHTVIKEENEEEFLPVSIMQNSISVIGGIAVNPI